MVTYKDFKIFTFSPIEIIYDLKLNAEGYFVTLSKPTYPFPMYAKVSKDMKTVTEVYPYMIAKTKEKSVKLLDEKRQIVYQSMQAPYYFSYNLETKDWNDDYLMIEGTLMKIRDEMPVNVYDYKKSREEIQKIKNGKIRKFVQSMNGDYACLYEDFGSTKAKKFFVGYSPSSEAWLKRRAELKDLFE